MEPITIEARGIPHKITMDAIEELHAEQHGAFYDNKLFSGELAD